MILVFVNGRGMIMVEYVPPNQPVNQEFYVCVLQDYRKYLKKELDLFRHGLIFL
jgi:hypothetical protein